MELSGTVGILTGASRGIGPVIARHLALKGVDLVLAARSPDGLMATAESVRSLGVRAVAVPTDVRRPEALEHLVAVAEREVGPVDLVVNNAGVEHYAYFEEIELGVIEEIIQTNVIAVEMLTRLVLPGMVDRARGHIANIASAAGKVPTPYNTVYASSKHALVGFSWSLRQEMWGRGVGVSVICPVFVSDTGLFHTWSRGRRPPSVARSVSPEDVASATVKAIERNLCEVVVSGGLGKVADVFAALAPDFTAAVSRRAGLYSFLESGVPYFRR